MNKFSDSIEKLLFIHLCFLTLMTIFRLVFFTFFQELEDVAAYSGDILKMFGLGLRIDLTVIGYIQAIPTILLILFYYLKPDSLDFLNKFFVYYLFVMFGLVSVLLISDFGFYSYFKEHINILFFGIIDDDTVTLIKSFWKNYNVLLILFVFFAYLFVLFKFISAVFQNKRKDKRLIFIFKNPSIFFIFFVIINFISIRGSFGMYPLERRMPNISHNNYINKISQNGVRSFVDACKIRMRSNSDDINYIKDCGFENIIDAFRIYKKGCDIDTKNLLNNITFLTSANNKNYNVVVIMVESFGMPILDYQSKKFDILGRLKKHFNEDILFTNIISDGNGTIASLESLFLNIPYRPNSFSVAQSVQANTSFTYTPAFLYGSSGYETTFIYGGDLTWRNFGAFAGKQGYKNIFGKINIYDALKKEHKKNYYFHPWGIYDEYLYDFIFNKLEKSREKEFIFALSTNNHPPYNVPNHFKNKKISYSKKLLSHITGDLELAKQRFLSYAYALDSVGAFLDKIKSSHLKDNTIVVITADNNTVEGIMKYDKNPVFTSKNIPIYFYLPPKLKSRFTIDTKVAGSGKDIFPTLYNMTLNNTKYISIGTNLFERDKRHYGFNGSLIVTDGKKTVKLQNLKDNSSEHSRYYRSCIAITDFLLKQYK